jgi:hypothetical protein
LFCPLKVDFDWRHTRSPTFMYVAPKIETQHSHWRERLWWRNNVKYEIWKEKDFCNNLYYHRRAWLWTACPRTMTTKIQRQSTRLTSEPTVSDQNVPWRCKLEFSLTVNFTPTGCFLYSDVQDDWARKFGSWKLSLKLEILLSLVDDPTMRSHCDHQLITDWIKQNNKKPLHCSWWCYSE